MRLTAGTLLGEAATSIVGALFFGTGILFTSVVNQMMFPMSVLSAIWPTLRKGEKDRSVPKRHDVIGV